MPIIYDIEKDALYRRGFKKGFEQGLKKAFENGVDQGLLTIKYLKAGKTIQETALLTKVPKKMVRKIKEQISK